MGSTLVGAVLTAGQLLTFNVGDSRCYLFSEGQLVQLSDDDVPEGGSSHFRPRRSHALAQALGGSSLPLAIEPHVTVDAPLAAGETLILCGDGLTDMLGDGAINGTLRAVKDLLHGARRLAANSWLGLQSSATLWQDDVDAVHFTSALRFPVFVGGQNYSGQPRMTSTPLLVRLLEEYLSEEAAALSHAVWVLLGPQATAAADWRLERGRLEARMVLRGLPHPSGANAERIAFFLQRKPREQLSSKTNPAALERTRSQLLSQVAALVASQERPPNGPATCP